MENWENQVNGGQGRKRKQWEIKLTSYSKVNFMMRVLSTIYKSRGRRGDIKSVSTRQV